MYHENQGQFKLDFCFDVSLFPEYNMHFELVKLRNLLPNKDKGTFVVQSIANSAVVKMAITQHTPFSGILFSEEGYSFWGVNQKTDPTEKTLIEFVTIPATDFIHPDSFFRRMLPLKDLETSQEVSHGVLSKDKEDTYSEIEVMIKIMPKALFNHYYSWVENFIKENNDFPTITQTFLRFSKGFEYK